jgi:hypothetical protein
MSESTECRFARYSSGWKRLATPNRFRGMGGACVAANPETGYAQIRQQFGNLTCPNTSLGDKEY